MSKILKPQWDELFSENEWAELSAELALSPREEDIIRCLFQGCSDKQIARRLQIRLPTIRTHLSRLFRKLSVNDREELILYVFRHFRSGCRKLDCPRK